MNDMILKILKYLPNKEIIKIGTYLKIKIGRILKIDTKLDLSDFEEHQLINLCRNVKLVSCASYATMFLVDGKIVTKGKIPADEHEKEYIELDPLLKDFVNVKQVAVGLRHALVLTNDGKLHGVGSNLDYQINRYK